MIEERARVMEAGSGYAWLEIQRRTACGGCQTSAGCGTAVLATLWEGKTIRVRAVSATPLQPGDEVIVGLADGVLLRGAVLVYLLPVILLLLGSALGQAAFGAAGEGWWRYRGCWGWDWDCSPRGRWPGAFVMMTAISRSYCVVRVQPLPAVV